MAAQNLRRIESPSGSVFSVAMTLRVLNLRVPAATPVRTEADVGPALLGLLPSIGGYVLGFLSLSIFWVCQSTQFTYLERSNRQLAWWHIAFLLAVEQLPFSVFHRLSHHPLLLARGRAGVLGQPAAARRGPARQLLLRSAHGLLRAVDAAVSQPCAASY